jgi:hypothetical protein
MGRRLQTPLPIHDSWITVDGEAQESLLEAPSVRLYGVFYIKRSSFLIEIDRVGATAGRLSSLRIPLSVVYRGEAFSKINDPSKSETENASPVRYCHGTSRVTSLVAQIELEA